MMPERNKEPIEFWINVVISEDIDQYGRKIRRTQWQKHNKELDLGSINKPKNQEVIGFEWREKSPIQKMFGIFDNL